MKEYLLLAAFMIPSVVVLAAAVVSISHADDSAARELLGSSIPCADEHFHRPELRARGDEAVAGPDRADAATGVRSAQVHGATHPARALTNAYSRTLLDHERLEPVMAT